MPEPEVHRSLGCSNRLYFFNECFRQTDPYGVSRQSEQRGDIERIRLVGRIVDDYDA